MIHTSIWWWPNAGLMLGQRHSCWTNLILALGQHFVTSELKDPICHSNECQIGSLDVNLRNSVVNKLVYCCEQCACRTLLWLSEPIIYNVSSMIILIFYSLLLSMHYQYQTSLRFVKQILKALQQEDLNTLHVSYTKISVISKVLFCIMIYQWI